jgi:hypothetical protein
MITSASCLKASRSHDAGVKELIFLHHRFIDNNRNTFRLDALHNALNRRGTEVVRTTLHDQAIHTHHFRLTGENRIRDKVFTGTVSIDDSRDDIVRDRFVVRQQLLGIFRQAVAAVAKGRVVIVVADTRIQAYPFDNLLAVQPWLSA